MGYVNSDQLSLDTALELLAANRFSVLAGGTDYYPGLNDSDPDTSMLGVRNIAGLDKAELVDGMWRIGAAFTWSDLINAELPQGFNCLKQAGREVGSIQIQNAATLVGNICNASPAADGVPALLALGAQVELSSVDGVRELPIAEFITGVRQTARLDTEMVTALLIPEANANDKTEFVKLGSRTYLVISIVMCASRIRVDDKNIITDAAITVGACSPVACRLADIEQALIGRKCSPDSLDDCVQQAHLGVLTPISDVRASAEYRLQATKVLLQRQLNKLAQTIAAGHSTSAT